MMVMVRISDSDQTTKIIVQWCNDECNSDILIFVGLINYRLPSKSLLGTPSRIKSSVFFNIVQTGGGGQTHVQNFLLQIWYNSGGYLAI